MAATYILGPFRLDAETDTLFRGGEPVSLGRRAVALLRVLVERRGIPVSKDALMEAAWAGLTVEESNLTVQIAALRRVLGEEPGGENWIRLNSLQQQERFDSFLREFNAERPHEALAMKCPAELYTASPRPYAGLPELTKGRQRLAGF